MARHPRNKRPRSENDTQLLVPSSLGASAWPNCNRCSTCVIAESQCRVSSQLGVKSILRRDTRLVFSEQWALGAIAICFRAVGQMGFQSNGTFLWQLWLRNNGPVGTMGSPLSRAGSLSRREVNVRIWIFQSKPAYSLVLAFFLLTATHITVVLVFLWIAAVKIEMPAATRLFRLNVEFFSKALKIDAQYTVSALLIVMVVLGYLSTRLRRKMYLGHSSVVSY